MRALQGVDLDVAAGEVHALLGENGAGKSTLMKVVAGSVIPDDGAMTLAGEPLPFGDPQAVHRRGVGVVYQELSLVPTLSVAENVLLGRLPTRFGRLVDRSSLADIARERLDRIGLHVDLETRVSQLGVAERQLIELAKAMSTDTRVLLLDEPTSALSDPEARRLFTVINDLTASGVGIVYVSHRLPEILRVADRITVLRDGQRVGTVSAGDVDEGQLARMMVGREVGHATRAASPATSASSTGDPALVARGFGRPPRLKPLDLTLHRGEVVTIFGLVGAGRTRLANALFGIEPATTGELEVFGERRRIRSPADAVGAGLGYLGEDRRLGLVPVRSVAENITLASLRRLARGPLLDGSRERELAEEYVAQLDMRVAGPGQRVDTLSGGNQQKVLLARWLCSQARILVLDDPTRGIDVGAKEEVFRLVRLLAEDGVAVLYLTSEIKEARSLGHRVLVMSQGAVVDELAPDTSDDAVMAAAGGIHG